MRSDIEETMMKDHKEFIGYILTLAESSLSPTQFRAFKKLILERFHGGLKPRIIDCLRNGEARSGRNANTNGQTMQERGCTMGG